MDNEVSLLINKRDSLYTDYSCLTKVNSDNLLKPIKQKYTNNNLNGNKSSNNLPKLTSSQIKTNLHDIKNNRTSKIIKEINSNSIKKLIPIHKETKSKEPSIKNPSAPKISHNKNNQLNNSKIINKADKTSRIDDIKKNVILDKILKPNKSFIEIPNKVFDKDKRTNINSKSNTPLRISRNSINERNSTPLLKKNVQLKDFVNISCNEDLDRNEENIKMNEMDKLDISQIDNQKS